ncbi:unnamed protein product, partial [Phaeothamnion confervicola]
VLLAGHLLADEDLGEASLVPETLQVGLAQEPQLERPLLMRFSRPFTALETQQAVETMVRLVSLLAQFLRYESNRLATSPAGADDPTLSPYLADGLLWCLARWAKTYLMPDVSLYPSGLDPRLLAAFGAAGGG